VRFLQRTPLVAAYVCPHGVFAIVGRRSGAGIEIERVIDAPAALASEFAAAEQVVSMLRNALIPGATVTIAVRGFGVVHHILQMPPASDELLGPIIEREVRRLEPDLGDSIIAWTGLPALEVAASEAVPQRYILAAAAPVATISAFEQRLRVAGHRLAHVTVLPAAMQRLAEEFDEGGGAVALVAPLPDGAFMGFSIGGGLRLIVEPPLPRDAEHESAALAEEVELGAMFVRQQFRGAQLDRIALVGSKDNLADAETMLAEKLHVPTRHLGLPGLSPAAFAALGAVLDDHSQRPLSLGGDSRGRAEPAGVTAIHSASVAAVFIVALVGAWTVTEAVRTQQAARAVHAARLQVQQDSFGLAPIRATADQRRLVRDAMAAARVVARDRVALQEALSGIAAAIRLPVRLDSLHLVRAENGWKAVLGGNAVGVTSAEAIQSLYDVYRELPQRLTVDSLRLNELAHADSETTRGPALVRFQLSFGIPARRGE
jgi:hypothetical protein